MMSSTCSRPTETRIMPSPMPMAARSSGVSVAAVIVGGCTTSVSGSTERRRHLRQLDCLDEGRPASRPPASSKVKTEPPIVICRFATSRCGCESSPGYDTRATASWPSRNSAERQRALGLLGDAHVQRADAAQRVPCVERRAHRAVHQVMSPTRRRSGRARPRSRRAWRRCAPPGPSSPRASRCRCRATASVAPAAARTCCRTP